MVLNRQGYAAGIIGIGSAFQWVVATSIEFQFRLQRLGTEPFFPMLTSLGEADWIRQLRVDGVILQLILLGLSTIFRYGFDLPLRWLEGICKVVLQGLTWKSH